MTGGKYTVKKVGVAILGLGVVGGGTYRILTENRAFYRDTQGLDVSVECVLERNPARAEALGVPAQDVAGSIEEVVSNPNVDIVVEVIGGVEPARTFVLKALRSGKSVVTSNKELVCKHWYELEEAAKNMNVGLYFEASCVGGVPIIRTLLDGTQANRISSIMGIINGTTNYILTRMAEDGRSYPEVLAEAQALGYAESDPTADVEGFDAAYKLSILSSLAFNTKIPLENVSRTGITGVTKEDIYYGKKLGYTLKLLGVGKRTEKGIEVRVHPTLVSDRNPLASVSDAFNAVKIVGDSVGDIMLYGRGAGALPTGSAIVSDVLYAAKHPEISYSSFKNTREADKNTKFTADFSSKYCIRMRVKDRNGVLAKVSGIMGKNDIGMHLVEQIGSADGAAVLVLITHETHESHIAKVLEKFRELEEVLSIDSVLKVEE